MSVPPDLITRPSHELGHYIPGHPFSYISISFYADWSIAQDISGLQQHCNTSARNIPVERNTHDNGDSKGMDLHLDRNTGYTVVLVIGALIKWFNQIYPTSGVSTGLACSSYSCSNSHDFLHAVARGTGFRIALIYTVHTSIATGVTDNSMERPLAWDLGVRQAKPYTVLDKAPERLKQLQKELEAAEVAASEA